MKSPILSVPEGNACGCEERAVHTYECICSTTGLMQIMGRKYAVRLLFLIGDRGQIRFGDLKVEMEEMSSSTLTIRLSELEGAGLVHRQIFNEIPPRVEYTLTKQGKDLRKTLFALSRFANRKEPRN